MSQSSKMSPVLAVAKWEFGRYYKLRDQLIGVVSLLIGGLIGIGSAKMAEYSAKVEIAVNTSELSLDLATDSKLTLIQTTESLEQLKEAVLNKKYDAALIVQPDSLPRDAESSGKRTSKSYELLVRSQPTWLEQLQTPLNQLQSREAMIAEGLTADRLAALFAPVNMTVTNVTDTSVSKLDRVIAVLVMFMIILTSWLGLAYFLSGISGEKQQRVTEQIVSAISPQSWIDGKLLGITAASIASVMSLLLTGAISLVIARSVGYDIPLPDAVARASLVVYILIYFLGGVFLWNCFYAAVATIINDPNTSARSSLMFVPVLPMAMAAMAIAKPDGFWMQVLSIVPGSSATAMPMRLLLSEVPAWELALSLTSLTVAILVLRTLAGRIFEAGILLVAKSRHGLRSLVGVYGRERRRGQQRMASGVEKS